MKHKNKLLYPIIHSVPFKVIKKVYEGNLRAKFYRRPITDQVVLDLYLQVLEEERVKKERAESGNDSDKAYQK